MERLRRAASVPALLCLAALGAGAADAWTLNEAGLALLRAGEAAPALERFEEALRSRPRDETLRRNAAAACVALAAQGERGLRKEESLRLLDRAVDLHPGRILYRVLRARLRIALGRDADFLAAGDDLVTAVTGDPGHLEALTLLAALRYQERRLADALVLLDRALALDPGRADLAGHRGQVAREALVEASFQEIRGPAFLVRYDPSIAPEEATRALAACEEAYGALCPRFGYYPPAVTVVTMYRDEGFAAATRAEPWVAGLHDGTIRLRMPRGEDRSGQMRSTLVHEFTHHLIRGIAPRAPGWLHEGLAQMAEERSVSNAAARLRSGPEPGGDELSRQAWKVGAAGEAGRLYDLSLCFTDFLRQIRGDGGVQDLLRILGSGAGENDALMSIYGAPRDELFARWRERWRGG